MNFKRYHVSRNLWDFERWLTDRGATYTKDGDSYTFASQQVMYSTPFYFSQTDVTVSISGLIEAVTATNPRVHLLKADGTRATTDALTTAVSKRENVSCAGLIFDWSTPGNIKVSLPMLNEGSTALPYEPYSSEVWHDIPHYIHKTDTDTLTTPADIYANDNNATVGLKGQMEQSSTPTPSSPIQPSECGDLETEGTHAGQYKIPILSNSTTTNVYLGEVETTRQVKKLVLTGEESGTWSQNPTITTGNAFYNEQSIIFPNYSPNKIGYCTHFATTTSSAVREGIYWGANINFITDINDNIDSPAKWKQYLADQYAAGTPVTIWYVLKNETTGIVNEPIRKIGDYADEVSGISIPVIAGANTISVGTTIQPSEVSVNYKGWHPVQNVHEAENGQWD